MTNKVYVLLRGKAHIYDRRKDDGINLKKITAGATFSSGKVERSLGEFEFLEGGEQGVEKVFHKYFHLI